MHKRITHIVLILAPLAFGLTVGQVADASEIVTETKLQASDAHAWDAFGADVSLSGTTALIGAQRDDDNGKDSGSVYVFVKQGDEWVEEAKLLAADGAEKDRFGSDVALFGDTAVVGAAAADAPEYGSGAAYVFVRNGGAWTQQAKLVPSDGEYGDSFGNAVSVSADTAVIGALHDDPNGFGSGSAYIFVRDGDEWTEQTKLVPADGQPFFHFGNDVSVWGDSALIGSASESSSGGEWTGSAYVFVRDGATWSEQAKLVASSPSTWDFFGRSVALHGDTALVGAPSTYNMIGSRVGSAYVFVRTDGVWDLQTQLLPSQSEYRNLFGSSVALAGNRALVGVRRADDNGPASGAAYTFARSGGAWSEEEHLLPEDGEQADEFGSSVSVAGGTLLVGVPYDDGSGSSGEKNSGSAWVFESDSLELSVSGACPGQATVTIWNAPASSEVAVVAAANDNGFIKGGGQCAGTQLEVGEPFQLPPVWLVVDGSGYGSTQLTLEPDRCWVEALALTSCETSGATHVP